MSTLNVSNITDGTTTVGTSYVVNGSAKAWCFWTQTSTQTIFDSFNTSSITDGGTGCTSVTMTSAMSNTTWAVSITGTGSSTSGGHAVTDSSGFIGNGTTPYRTTTTYNVRGVDAGATAFDHPDVNGIAYGVLA